ncbi:MAG TPA: energy transducer TonB [Burkholderiales bacterium]|nr:energy transducer TonB [Burkholderiales bacterium]
MSVAQTFEGFEEREEPGLLRAVLLAFGVHLVLIVILFLGVRWQSHPPAAMTVELWRELPTKPAPKVQPPPPKLEPKPQPPPPKVEPKVEPKPEPRIEKPDIAIKEPPKPKPKPPPPKPVAKPQPKPAPPKDDEVRKQLNAELAKEEAAIKTQQQEAEIRQLLAAEAASDRSKALASWVDKIRAKIRGNIVLPPGIKGNPEARFVIVLLPTGEVLDVRKTQSSGLPALDDAIDRAIRKSSPLPKPDDTRVFERKIEITYRPLDEQ